MPISIEQQAYAVGDLYLNCGISRTEMENFSEEEVESLFNKSIDCYSRGAEICKKSDKDHTQFLAKRGYAKLRKKTVSRNINSIENLNSIVDDLEYAKPNYYTSFNPLPTALYWRAKYYADNNEYDNAISDLEHALTQGVPTRADPQILEQIQRIELALVSCKLEKAIHRESSDEVINNLKEIVTFEPSLRSQHPANC